MGGLCTGCEGCLFSQGVSESGAAMGGDRGGKGGNKVGKEKLLGFLSFSVG